MVDATLIEILAVVISVFFGAIITLMIYFANGIKDQISEMDEKINKVDEHIEGVNQRIDSLILHLVPKPNPAVIPTTTEPLTTPEPELLTGTD